MSDDSNNCGDQCMELLCQQGGAGLLVERLGSGVSVQLPEGFLTEKGSG